MLLLTRVGWCFMTPLMLLLAATPSQAQDRFEIHVYEYETLPPGQFTLETHLNYVGIGATTAEGTVAPTNNQFHMTFELTGGLVNNVSLGVMLLTAERPGGPTLEYAGWRILPPNEHQAGDVGSRQVRGCVHDSQQCIGGGDLGLVPVALAN